MKELVRPLVLGSCLIFALGLLFALPQPAEACMSCHCELTPDGTFSCKCTSSLVEDGDYFDSVVVRFPDRNGEKPVQAVISIFGYHTTSIENGFACIVAVPDIPGMKSIDAITNYNTITGEPLEHVTFSPSNNASDLLGELAYESGISPTDAPWTTFVSHITGRVADGIPNHFEVEVTLDGEVTRDEFVRNLQSLGAFFTGSSDQAGYPDHGHGFLKQMADFDVFTFHPAKPVVERPEQGQPFTPLAP